MPNLTSTSEVAFRRAHFELTDMQKDAFHSAAAKLREESKHSPKLEVAQSVVTALGIFCIVDSPRNYEQRFQILALHPFEERAVVCGAIGSGDKTQEFAAVVDYGAKEGRMVDVAVLEHEDTIELGHTAMQALLPRL